MREVTNKELYLQNKKRQKMSKLINVDSDYSLWINQLVERYSSCQIRATVKAYEELLRFYWSTGEDIIKKKAESRWGEGVIN